MRLASQRLTPETAAADALEAARAVVGIQAQDLRAMGLALRSRVPGLERAAIIEHPELVRTWTVRGTVHLVAADDLPWLHALTGPRNARRFELLIAKRGNLEHARSILSDLVATLEREGPLSRAALLERLAQRGHPSLGPSSVNVLMPWVAAQGLIAGLPDGRFRAAEPPPPVEEDEALAVLAARYLAGYGPAGAADLAKWSGLPVSSARRALEAAGERERSIELLALPGTFEAEPPEAPPALLLAPFDTSMLGWRTREPLVAAGRDERVLPGGGIVKAVLLTRGRAAATWRVEGSGRRRRLVLDRFGRPAPAGALRAEADDVARFLEIELSPAT